MKSRGTRHEGWRIPGRAPFQRAVVVAVCAGFAAAMLLPLVQVLAQYFDGGLASAAGNYAGALLKKRMARAVGHSLLVSGLAAACSTAIAFMCAYFLWLSSLPRACRGIFRTCIMAAFFFPSITYGFAIIFSFGKQGACKPDPGLPASLLHLWLPGARDGGDRLHAPLRLHAFGERVLLHKPQHPHRLRDAGRRSVALVLHERAAPGLVGAGKLVPARLLPQLHRLRDPLLDRRTLRRDGHRALRDDDGRGARLRQGAPPWRWRCCCLRSWRSWCSGAGSRCSRASRQARSSPWTRGSRPRRRLRPSQALHDLQEPGGAGG